MSKKNFNLILSFALLLCIVSFILKLNWIGYFYFIVGIFTIMIMDKPGQFKLSSAMFSVNLIIMGIFLVRFETKNLNQTDQGVNALIITIILISLFMAIYYKKKEMKEKR